MQALREIDLAVEGGELVAVMGPSGSGKSTLLAIAGSLEEPSSGATAAGLLLALGILAMTIGLIRGEAAGDLRTLTATGATGRTRRTLTAATSGALALLGTGGAYLALTAGYDNDLGSLSRVPLPQLASFSPACPWSRPPAAGSWPGVSHRPWPANRWSDSEPGNAHSVAGST